MNAGKLVAQLAALAIIVYCSYSAVISAIPTDPEELKNPISVDHMDIIPASSGLEMNFTIDGQITSKLPQDIVDVSIAIYMGSGKDKLELTSVDIGSITAKSATPIHKEGIKIPTYAILAYAVCCGDSDDSMNIPLCTQVAFKYLKWQESYLVDLGITIKVDYKMEGVAPHIESAPDHGAKVTVTIDDDAGIYKTVAEQVKAYMDSESLSDLTLSCGDADIIIKVDTSTGTEVSFEINGNSEKSADVLLKEYMDNHDGNLAFTFGTDEYELSAENASTFLDIIKTLYGGVSA